MGRRIRLSDQIIREAFAELREEELRIKELLEREPPDMTKIGKQTDLAFDREIRRIAHGHKKKYYTIYKQDYPKIAVYFIAVIIASITLAACIWMGRKIIARYNTENVDLGLQETDVHLDFVYYSPRYLPQGYELEEEELYSTYSNIQYRNSEGTSLRIEQFSPNTILSEDIKGEFYEREHKDQDYYYTERYGDTTLIFELDGFIFKIEGVGVFEDELLKIYLSMEKR